MNRFANAFALFSLHESWDELKRYTNLRPERMRDLTPPSPAPASNEPWSGKQTAMHSELMPSETDAQESTNRKRAA